jgi:hypothetical protein
MVWPEGCEIVLKDGGNLTICSAEVVVGRRPFFSVVGESSPFFFSTVLSSPFAIWDVDLFLRIRPKSLDSDTTAGREEATI